MYRFNDVSCFHSIVELHSEGPIIQDNGREKTQIIEKHGPCTKQNILFGAFTELSLHFSRQLAFILGNSVKWLPL
jgi:hypothetical protein